MWLVKSLVGDRPSWHKEPIFFLNKMLSIRKVRLLITSRYIAMQSYECVIISKMFLIYFISYGCNGGALVFLGGAEASASPSFALPMFITIKKIIILHLFLGVPAATVGVHKHAREVWEDLRHSYREADGKICNLFEFNWETDTLKCYGESRTLSKNRLKLKRLMKVVENPGQWWHRLNN